MDSPKVFAIVAMDESRVIGKDGGLPWHLKEDMQRFSKLTRGHSVLMGRKTFDSLPETYRPLPQRKNFVISRTLEASDISNVEIWHSPIQLFEAIKSKSVILQGEILWIIGGQQIYSETMPYWDEVYLTLVNGHHAGDAFFPRFESEFIELEREPHGEFSFVRYQRVQK